MSPYPRSAQRWCLAGLSLTGAVFVWCWWQIRALGDVRLQLGTFYGYFAAAGALYLIALWLVRRRERAGGPVPVASLGVILLVAVLARVALLGATPTVSDDIYRYRWDGRVQQAGIDPYAYPPNAPELASLRDAQSALINFPQLRTVYPPLTERAFRLGVALGDTLTSQKLVFVFAELLTALSLLVILRRRGRSMLWVAAYAWHPLAILEIAGSGHNDALGIAALWMGLAAWQGRWWLGSTLAWVAAFLSKFLSVILVPWWWCRRAARGWLAIFLLLSALTLAWHPTLMTALVESLSAMTARSATNALFYPVLEGLAGGARFTPLVAIGVWVAFLVWWARREADPLRYLFGAFTVAVLLSPAMHPWYLVWLVPFFCFWRVPALLLLTGTVVLAYTVWPGYLDDGRWAMPGWARLAEYVPVAILGVWEVRRCAWRSSFLPATKPRRCATS